MYARRSLTTQYQETDFAFLERLLAEEGLFCWYEHADGGDDALGSHALVIADHNAAFPADPQGSVRLHRADVTEPDDTIQSWRAVWLAGPAPGVVFVGLSRHGYPARYRVDAPWRYGRSRR